MATGNCKSTWMEKGRPGWRQEQWGRAVLSREPTWRGTEVLYEEKWMCSGGWVESMFTYEALTLCDTRHQL